MGRFLHVNSYIIRIHTMIRYVLIFAIGDGQKFKMTQYIPGVDSGVNATLVGVVTDGVDVLCMAAGMVNIASANVI